MKIPKNTQKILWDVDWKKIDVNKNKVYLITRLAEKGDWKSIAWLKNIYGLPNIKKIINNNKEVSKKTKNFWQVIS